MRFNDFVIAMSDWADDPELGPIVEQIPEQWWSAIYETGSDYPDGTLFSADDMARALRWDGDADVIDVLRRLEQQLNSTFGGDAAARELSAQNQAETGVFAGGAAPAPASGDTSSEGSANASFSGVPGDSVPAQSPSMPAAAPVAAATAVPAMPSAGEQSAAAGTPPAPGVSPAATQASTTQLSAAQLPYIVPGYDYSRENLDNPDDPAQHRSVSVQVLNDGSLHYSWPDPGEGEMFRVVTGDHEDPYNPDDGQDAGWNTSPEFIDSLPPSTTIRFVTVWGYPIPAEGTVLGQPRRVASTAFVLPLSNWRVRYQEENNTLEGRWDAPQAPDGGSVRVLTAKCPLGTPVSRFIGRGLWDQDEYAVVNNGGGFQDREIVGGTQHHYVAAVEVTLGDMTTHRSLPQVASFTPPVRTQAIDELAISTHEPLSDDEPTHITVTWSQHQKATVRIYRTMAAPNEGARAQGLIQASQLPSAGLADSDLVDIAQGVSGVDERGFVSRTITQLVWPDSSQWDSLYLTAVTMTDDGRALIGAPHRLKRAGVIRNLTLTRRITWDLVTFSWPGDAARVDLRGGDLHNSFDPNAAPLASVEREDYLKNRGLILPQPLPTSVRRLWANAITLDKGREIPSEPVSVAVEPLWSYSYDLLWPKLKVGASMLGKTWVELTVQGITPVQEESSQVGLRLLYHPTRIPLSIADAGEGRIVDLYTEKPTKEGGQTAVTEFFTPGPGQELSLWFDYSEFSKGGYFRLVVASDVASRLDEANRARSLEHYALIDPPISHLRKG